MANNQDIAGISVGIGANTSDIDAKLDNIEGRLKGLQNFNLNITAKVNVTSIKQVVTKAKQQLAELSKTPISARFDFGINRSSVRQLQVQLTKQITDAKGLKVQLSASATDLINSLGKVVIPVTLNVVEWTGKKPPKDMEEEAEGGGGVRPAPRPRRPTGGGASEEVARVTGEEGSIGAIGGLIAGVISEQAVEKAVESLDKEVKAKIKGRVVKAKAASTVATPVQRTEIPANEAAGRRIQAQAGVSRGIYPSGTPISELRRQIEQNVGLSAGIGVSTTNPLYQRYISAGGDPESLKIGIARPLPGNEAKYAAAFAKESIARHSEPRAEVAGQSRNPRPHPMDVRQSGIHRAALPLTPAQYERELDQRYDKAFHEEIDKLELKSQIGKGASAGAAGRHGELIEGMRQELFEALVEPDMEEKIAQLHESSRGLFALGAIQRKELVDRYVAKGKSPEKGRGRFRRLVGQRGKIPTTGEAYEIVTTRNMALAASAELSRLAAIQSGENEQPGSESEAVAQAAAQFRAKAARKGRGQTQVAVLTPEERKALADKAAEETRIAAANEKETRRAANAAKATVQGVIPSTKKTRIDRDLGAIADARLRGGTSLADEMRARDAAARAREKAGQSGVGLTKKEFEAQQGMEPYETLLSGLPRGTQGGPRQFANRARSRTAEEELAKRAAEDRKAAERRTVYATYAARYRRVGGEAAYASLTPGQQKVLGTAALDRAIARNAPALIKAIGAVGKPGMAAEATIPKWPKGATVQFEDLNKKEQREALMGNIPQRVLDSVKKGGGGTAGRGLASAYAQLGDPSQFKEMRDEAVEGENKISQNLREMQLNHDKILRENPVRAMSVAVAQWAVQTIGGRNKLEKAVKTADYEASKALRTNAKYEKAKIDTHEAQAKFDDAVSSGANEELQTLAGEKLGAAKSREDKLKTILSGRMQRVATSEADLAKVSRFSTARTLAVGGLGVAVGTTAFSLIMGAVQGLMQQFGIGLGRAVMRLTNFEEVTGQITGAMADQARGNFGQVRAAVAQGIAGTGLGDQAAAAIAPILEARTRAVAGAKAATAQAEMIRAAQNIAPGMMGGIDVRGLTQTTGGIGVLGIGGERSYREIIGNELQAYGQQYAAATAPNRMLTGRQATTGTGVSGQTGSQILMNRNAYVASINENIARSRLTNLRLTTNTSELAKDFKALDAALVDAKTKFPAYSSELQTFVENLHQGNVAISGGVTAQGLIDILYAGATGSIMPSKQQLFAAAIPQMQVGVAQAAYQGQYERQNILPGQAYMQQLQRPLVPLGQTGVGRALSQIPGMGASAEFKLAASSIDAAQTGLREYAKQGELAAHATLHFADANSGLHLEKQWMDATSAVGFYGAQITKLQQAMSFEQTVLQTHQYNEQLRLANQSLRDAQEFVTGIKAANSDGLGILEKQTREIGIQSTLLGFQLSQRQINFQVAMAGFVAPGTTPQERYARVQEAKKEAEFAQKQLDLQKQAFTVGQQVIDVNAARAIVNINKQLALLTEGRRVTIDIQLKSEQVAAAQSAMDKATAQAQSFLTEAQNIQQQIQGVMVTIEAQTADSIINAVKGALRALGISVTALNALFGSAPSNAMNYLNSGKVKGLASGVLTNVSSATPLIVGEAGRETVAILRNPRGMSLGGGMGGGTQININMNGTTVRNDQDIDKLAMAVQRKVEESMGRKASQYGLRAAR